MTKSLHLFVCRTSLDGRNLYAYYVLMNCGRLLVGKIYRDGVLEDMALASRHRGQLMVSLALASGVKSLSLALALASGKIPAFLVSCDYDHLHANVQSHRCFPPMNDVALVLEVRTLPAKYLYLQL